MNKVVMIVSFVLGFIVASHWDYGRDMVREISPFAPKTLGQKLKKMTGQDAGTKAKKLLEAVEETVKDKAKKLEH
ncbi:MAG: hypothetical protein K9K67_08080 [Bacteriovoracaceae bacterium]|nr:hypothetical protein [Bacteriovoracaceae bacterium]